MDDDAFMTDYNFSLQKAITNIEGKVGDDSLPLDDDDIMPSAAADMGSGEKRRDH